MSAVASPPPRPRRAAAPRSAGSRPGASAAARIERRKLLAQLPLRLLGVVCLLGPVIFAVLLKVQSGAPSDALFGAWVHTSGFAVSLVVLGFAANWGFPIIAGVLAGDLFAGEDRQGTWKTILTRSRTLEEVFAGKVLAALSLALALGVTLAAASLVAGLALVGAHALVNFGGRELAPLHLLALVTLSWLLSLLPLLAYTSLAILFSVVSRNGIVGVMGPVLVALITQLLDLIGKGVVVHFLLIGSAFDAWHGLFAEHPFFGPLVISLIVCLAWIAACLGASWQILSRRDFAGGSVRRAGWPAAARLALGSPALVTVLAIAAGWGPAGVTAPRLTASLSLAFRRLTLLQQRLLGHPIPAGARYRILPTCGGGPHSRRQGPGDWTCTMNVYVVLPGSSQPLTDTQVGYDVSVQYNGCYKASSPPAFVGQALIRDTSGQMVTNPLTTIYGCLNVL